jgi:glutamyl-tRNA synthetase
MRKPVTRFAPSPTGTLHIGGARTALYNYLFTRHEGGTFLLRIEDTDRIRSTRESVEVIYESLAWLSIKWDKEPCFQSSRLKRYHEVAELLLKAGRAYQRTDLDKGTAVIFRADKGLIEWDDLIHGKIGRDISQDPDLVLLKSDGYPTYNFACVVDDIDLEITHVIRGDDHIPNTPKQISVFRALDAPIPKYAHIPLILNPDGSKMSKDYKKRHPGKEIIIPTSVLAYRKMGYLPEALANFLALLGWSPGDDREIMSMKEMIELFSLQRVKNCGAKFNLEKLTWMNGHYIRKKSLDELVEIALPYLSESFDISKVPTEKIRQAIAQQHERLKTLAELPELTRFFFQDEVEYDPQAVQGVLCKEGTGEILNKVIEELERLESFDTTELERIITDLRKRLGIKLQEVAQPIRVCITGSTVSPPIYDTMALLGKQRVLERLRRGLRLVRCPAP